MPRFHYYDFNNQKKKGFVVKQFENPEDPEEAELKLQQSLGSVIIVQKDLVTNFHYYHGGIAWRDHFISAVNEMEIATPDSLIEF